MSGNITTIYHSLNAGEVSPRMAARQDQNKYPACCETMLNAVPMVVGGARIREGSLYVDTTKTIADHPLKIIRPFVASRTAAYVMEIGHHYVRFFKDGAALFAGVGGGANTASKRFSLLGFDMPWDEPLPAPDGLVSSSDRFQLLGLYGLESIGELITPWDDTDLAELYFVQSIDVCYVLHRNYAPRKILRITETEFTITQVHFNPPATTEQEPTGEDLGMGTLTPTAVTGDGVTFDSESGGFLDADVGRIIVAGGSRAQIATIVDTDTITADIIDDFQDTSPIPAAQWRMTLSPQTTLDITNKRVEVGQVVTLTAADAAFRAADAGKWITMFGGLLQIDTVNSATSVKATIKVRLKDITVDNPTPTRAWTLEIAAWSALLGYPSSGCFFQGRLWLFKGQTINGSVSFDFENFAKGGDASAAIAETISDDDLDVIVWGKGDKTLKVGTKSGVYECSPTTQNGALTPSSFRIDPIDPNGSARIAPIRVSPVLMYVDVSQRELRELSYSFADDNYKSPHLFRLAEHLVDGFYLTELCYVSAPDSILYAVRNDGVLLGLVYEQVESVIGWYRIETDGLIKSICKIPRPDTGKDWLWFIVERDNGTFIEYFEPDHPSTGREWNELHTDCAFVTTHDANFVVGTADDLSPLEGKTVWAIGDGQLFNASKNAAGQIVSTAVITSGVFTLDPPIAVSKVEVGLDYNAVIVPVEPMVPTEAGGPMIARGYSKIGIRVRHALGLTLRAYRVNMNEPGDSTILGESLAYRKPYHPMDAQVPLQRGKKCIINLGYDPFARIEIRQSLPFPAEILNVVGKLHVGDEWECDTYNDSEVFF